MPTLKIGILGAAGIAASSMIAPVRRRDDVEIVAVASRHEATAFAARHGIAVAYSRYDDLIADPSIDLVYIALPPSEHARWSIAALEAGRHVLCEKPMTMNAAEARAVFAAAERTGRRAFEAFHDYHHPLQARMRDLIAAGTLGSPVTFTATFTGPNPYDPHSLRHDPELGGGALRDLGCYPVHWVRSLFGEPRVLAAAAEQNPLGADVSIAAELGYEGGLRGQVIASMQPDVPLSSTITVVGEAGTLQVDNLVFPSRGHSIRLEQGGVTRVSTVAGLETYDHQLAAVLDGLHLQRPLATEGLDYVGNMTAIDAIYGAAGIR